MAKLLQQLTFDAEKVYLGHSSNNDQPQPILAKALDVSSNRIR